MVKHNERDRYPMNCGGMGVRRPDITCEVNYSAETKEYGKEGKGQDSASRY